MGNAWSKSSSTPASVSRALLSPVSVSGRKRPDSAPTLVHQRGDEEWRLCAVVDVGLLTSPFQGLVEVAGEAAGVAGARDTQVLDVVREWLALSAQVCAFSCETQGISWQFPITPQLCALVSGHHFRTVRTLLRSPRGSHTPGRCPYVPVNGWAR